MPNWGRPPRPGAAPGAAAEAHEEGAATPGRRARIRRDELADQLLAAGAALLREQGTANVAAEVTFQRVYERLAASGGGAVTNASVIGRIWDSLADYQRELVCTIARDDSAVEHAATLDAILPVLRGADTATAAGRSAALAEVVRVGAAANLRRFQRSREWMLTMGIWSMAATWEEPRLGRSVQRVGEGEGAGISRGDLVAALREGYDRATTYAEMLYVLALRTLGWRVKAGTTLRAFTLTATALAEGFALRALVDTDATDEITLEGDDRPWTPFGRAFLAVTLDHLELDPDGECEPVDAVIAELLASLDAI